MSLFIKPEDKFNVTVRYVENENKIRVVEEDSAAEESEQSITVTCRIPNFEMSQVILHSATIFTENGIPVVDMLRVRKAMLYHLAVSWDVEDEGKPVSLSAERISAMNPVVASALCAGIQNKVGDPIAILMS
jgi:hypothetical protein